MLIDVPAIGHQRRRTINAPTVFKYEIEYREAESRKAKGLHLFELMAYTSGDCIALTPPVPISQAETVLNHVLLEYVAGARVCYIGEAFNTALLVSMAATLRDDLAGIAQQPDFDPARFVRTLLTDRLPRLNMLLS